MTAALDSHVNITLDSLAAEINREHEAVKAAFQKGLEHAIKAGEHLIEAKKAVPHGKWGTWLSDHCSVSERMAQHYMKVASEFPKLEPANAKRVSDLSLRAALAELANPSDHEAVDGIERVPKGRPATIDGEFEVVDVSEPMGPASAPETPRTSPGVRVRPDPDPPMQQGSASQTKTQDRPLGRSILSVLNELLVLTGIVKPAAAANEIGSNELSAADIEDLTAWFAEFASVIDKAD